MGCCLKTITFLGCTVNPGTKNKYCKLHINSAQPCIDYSALSREDWARLRNEKRQNKSENVGVDTVLVIEGMCHVMIKMKH